jgi:hypothetical protein
VRALHERVATKRTLRVADRELIRQQPKLDVAPLHVTIQRPLEVLDVRLSQWEGAGSRQLAATVAGRLSLRQLRPAVEERRTEASKRTRRSLRLRSIVAILTRRKGGSAGGLVECSAEGDMREGCGWP